MTTHKSDAVTSGIMPDYTRAGVVLCRHCEYTTTADVASGDTIQLVPVPKDANVLDVHINVSDISEGINSCNVGYGGDADAFLANVAFSTDDVFSMTGESNTYGTGSVGFLHKFTADDTVDLAFQGTHTLPTSSVIRCVVYYKMVGSISDET